MRRDRISYENLAHQQIRFKKKINKSKQNLVWNWTMNVINHCIEAFKARGSDNPMKKKKSVVIYELKTLFL